MSETDRMSALERSAWILNYRMRSERELRSKLLEKGYSEEETEEAVRELKEAGILDDLSYAKLYIRQEEEKGRGSVRIRGELLRRGISKETAERAFLELADESVDFGAEPESEEDRAMRIALDMKKRYPELEPRKLSEKIARRLQSRGYPGNIVYSVAGRFRKADFPDEPL